MHHTRPVRPSSSTSSLGINALICGEYRQFALLQQSYGCYLVASLLDIRTAVSLLHDMTWSSCLPEMWRVRTTKGYQLCPGYHNGKGLRQLILRNNNLVPCPPCTLSTNPHWAQVCQSPRTRRTQEMSPQNKPTHRIEKVGPAAWCDGGVHGDGGGDCLSAQGGGPVGWATLCGR